MKRGLIASLAALCLGGQTALACVGPGTTQVDELYPSANVLPENLLRLYLYFTGPMADADILPYIALHHEDGTLVEGVFLSNRFDLWSPDRTRLTVLLDPGRVKTGLYAHDALGRALVPGERYVLHVGTGAQDAAGCDLANAFSHGFSVGPTDKEPPDPSNWTLDVPKTGSTDPLRISLGSSHDHLSMAFRIRVKQGGQILPGRVGLESSETEWTFTPRAPWTSRSYELSIGEELEDLAGNRPGQLFDQPVGLELPQPDLQIWFEPGAP